MYLSSSADNKSRADGLIAVHLLNLCGHLSGHRIHDRSSQLPHFLRGDGVLDQHDILVSNLVLSPAAQLDILCSLKIHEVILHDQLRDLIPRQRYHAVRDNAPIPRHRNIGGSSSDIHQGNVEQPKILRDRDVDRRDRLQRQIGHTKSRHSNCRIQTIHNVLRQEGHNHVLADLIRLVGLQIRERLIVEIIPHDRIADTVKLIFSVVHLL